jgi:hypothetical protein
VWHTARTTHRTCGSPRAPHTEEWRAPSSSASLQPARLHFCLTTMSDNAIVAVSAMTKALHFNNDTLPPLMVSSNNNDDNNNNDDVKTVLVLATSVGKLLSFMNRYPCTVPTNVV